MGSETVAFFSDSLNYEANMLFSLVDFKENLSLEILFCFFPAVALLPSGDLFSNFFLVRVSLKSQPAKNMGALFRHGNPLGI